MCFVLEPDWYADVQEEEELVSDGTARCGDCGCRIAAGAPYTRFEQRQYEQCQQCEDVPWWRDSREEAAAECESEGHDYGEEFQFDMCGSCEAFRKAVSAVEVREGCGADESQPGYGDLATAVLQSDHLDEYVAEAVALDPGLAFSGYLDRLLTSKPPTLLSEITDDEDLAGAWCWSLGEPADRFEVGGEA